MATGRGSRGSPPPDEQTDPGSLLEGRRGDRAGDCCTGPPVRRRKDELLQGLPSRSTEDEVAASAAGAIHPKDSPAAHLRNQVQEMTQGSPDSSEAHSLDE